LFGLEKIYVNNARRKERKGVEKKKSSTEKSHGFDIDKFPVWEPRIRNRQGTTKFYTPIHSHFTAVQRQDLKKGRKWADNSTPPDSFFLLRKRTSYLQEKREFRHDL